MEASKLDNVKDALRGFRFVFHSKPATLVKMTEMIDTITVPKPKEQLLGELLYGVISREGSPRG